MGGVAERTGRRRPSARRHASGVGAARRDRSARPGRARAAATPPKRPRSARAGRAERRYRQTIHRVDLWSVLKISVCFYICGMAVTMVALVALWVIADAAGVITSVEKFFGDLLQTEDSTFLDAEILRGRCSCRRCSWCCRS